MKQPIMLLLLLCFSRLCLAQQYSRDLTCYGDTVLVPEYARRSMMYPTRTIPAHREVRCYQMSNMGIRADVGISNFYYNQKTKQWLGDHRSVYLGLSVAYRNYNVGIKFKTNGVTPQKQLAFGSDTLSKEDKVNDTRIEYFFSYSLDFKRYFSAEPYIAMSKTSFYGYSERDTNKTFSIPKTWGLATGLTINKYFRIKNFNFLSLFITGDYAFTNFKKIDSQLGRGYAEWTFGISYKGFAKMPVLHTVP